MKRIIIILLAGFTMLSCSEFLIEEKVATLDHGYFETEEGMEDLIRGCYFFLRYRTGFEQAYALFNFGVDEYTESAHTYWDLHNKYNKYGTELNASVELIYDLWRHNYRAIDNCNVGIERIPKIDDAVGYMRTEEGRLAREAELRFLRAYYYSMLVIQFGDIPLTLKPVTALQLEWDRAPVADVYQAIIDDLEFAVKNLPERQTEYGRVTANAARHYLAKAYLTRASAVNEDRGTQPDDLTKAAQYADEAIFSGANSLLPNYADVWDINNQQNDEVVFPTMYDTNPANIVGSGPGYQNRAHLFWLNEYEFDPGMIRALYPGRPYRRMMATDYALDIHDRLNDSRLRKSLKEVFMANNEDPASYPNWTVAELQFAFADYNPADSTATRFGVPVKAGEPKFALGDTALVYLVNDLSTSLTDRQMVALGYTVYARYFWETDASGNPINLIEYEPDVINDLNLPGDIRIRAWLRGWVPTLNKHLDGNRAEVNAESGTRDVFNARLAETYLLAAEAYGRAGNYAMAAERLNTVRRRAAYKAGEAKPPFWWMVDGGAYNDQSSTESAMEIDATYWDTDRAIEHYPPSATSTEQRFIHFMLNERCRELLGEFQRWEDLVRTETLVERGYLFNPDIKTAGSLKEHHMRRPIPRQHLDLIQINGAPLDAAQRAAYQNPGYLGE